MKWSLLLGFLMLPAPGVSSDLADLAEARKLCDTAVALFQAEQFAQGYGVVRPYWPLSSAEIDRLVTETGMQWSTVRQLGASVGTECVQETKVGMSLARYIYLHKLERGGIRWVFTFYKPRDRWMVRGVKFDNNIEALFEGK